MQSSLTPDVIAIRNKIQDTAQDDLRGISSFKEAFAEARRRGLRQFSWGKGSYTTELRRDPPPPPPKDGASGTGGGSTNREVPESLKGRDTSVQAGESNAAKPAAKPTEKGGSTATKAKTATPTPTPTPLQPVNPWRVLGLLAGTTAVGAGTIYGVEKYAKYKADKRRDARASAPSAPKPSIFRNLGNNAKEYLSKVPFKEKVNEYTSKASNLFKRTPATTAAVAPTVEPSVTFRTSRAGAAPPAAIELVAPSRTPRVKARAGAVPRMLTAPRPEINPLSLDRWWQ